MKKLLVAITALFTVSAFADGHNMIRFYGFEDGGNSRSFDVSMSSDDSDATGETQKSQNISINYARAFGQFQVGLTYRSASSSTSTVDNAGTTTGLNFYYNMESDLKNTCYFALHYLMHAASDGTYNAVQAEEGIGEDDKATTIALEYGHRWSIGSGWGFNLTYAPSITYNMTSYDWDNSANDDTNGKSETSLAWNWLKFDVLF